MIEIHIAGLDVIVGHHLRQRCAWCGALLDDLDVSAVMTTRPDDRVEGIATWKVGALVARDGNMTYVVAHEDGAQLPADCCATLDPEVTR